MRPAMLLAALAMLSGVRALPAQRPTAVAGAWRPATDFTSQPPVPAEPVRRRVTVQFDHAPLGRALAELASQADFVLFVLPKAKPAKSDVTVTLTEVQAVDALVAVLQGTGLEAWVAPDGKAVRVEEAMVRAPARPVQTGTVTGRITEAKTGQGIVNVEVQLEGTKWRTATGEDGRYRLAEVEVGSYTLSARRIGYAKQSQAVTVTAEQEVQADLALEPVPLKLDEIVTTVTGERRRFEVGNAIATINADSVVQVAPITNINDLLQGRAPGLQVYYNGGSSGLTSPIRIRGTNSITLSNDPIMIIDGARVEASPSSGSALGLAGGRLGDLNPDEIESVEIVKGPSAATLYGTDAANGVIVITTKRGQAGQARWRVWTEGGRVAPVEHYQPHYWAWGTNLTTGAVEHCMLVQVSQHTCRQDSLTVWNPLEDAATTPLGRGSRYVVGTQVSGGVSQFNYFVSGERESETGYLQMPAGEVQRLETERGVSSLPDWQLRPNGLGKNSLRANVGTTIGRTATLQLSTGLVFNKTRIPSNHIYESGALDFGAPPTANEGWGYATPGDLFSVFNEEKTTRSTTSLSATFQPFSWLALHGTAGLDYSNVYQDGLQLNGEGPVYDRGGTRTNDRREIELWSGDVGATASYSLRPGLTSRTSIGAQYNRRQDDLTSVFAQGLPPGGQTTAGATTVSGYESSQETIVAGAYAEETFGVGERLFLTGAVRLDGASTFGRAFDVAAYPKASASWVVADGTRGPRLPGISSLRLRAAYGTSGVQPGTVDALAREYLYAAVVNGTTVTASDLSSLGNPSLRPERQMEFETGLDAEWLGGRLRTEFTFYTRQSTDAIVSIPLPPSLGGFSRLENLGEVRNRGIEAALDARVIDSRPLTFDLSLNGFINQNRLLTLGGEATPNPSTNQPGYPLFSSFDFPIAFQDANHDGIITPDELTVGSSREFQLSPRPERQITAATSLGFFRDALRISAQFDYRGGYQMFDAIDESRCYFGTCRAVNDPSAPLAAQAAAQAYATDFVTSGFVRDGSFIRFRELSASLNVPHHWLRALGLHSAVLTVAGRNLGFITSKFSGFSPEAVYYPDPQFADRSQGGYAGSPTGRYWLVRLTMER